MSNFAIQIGRISKSPARLSLVCACAQTRYAPYSIIPFYTCGFLSENLITENAECFSIALSVWQGKEPETNKSNLVSFWAPARNLKVDPICYRSFAQTCKIFQKSIALAKRSPIQLLYAKNAWGRIGNITSSVMFSSALNGHLLYRIYFSRLYQQP